MSTSNNGDAKIPETGGSAVVAERSGIGISKPQNLSIDDIMWRVREEVARRSGQMGSTVPTDTADIRSFDESLPKWKSVVQRPALKDEYALAELLAFSDADFIDIAYFAILHRAPDQNEFNHYLQLLRNGAASKVEILWTLSSCQEGQAGGVRVVGLRSPYVLQQWRRKRFIGPIIRWIHAFLRLGTLADRLSDSEATQAREIQETGRVINLAGEYLVQHIASVKLQLAARSAEFECLKNEYAALIERLAELEHLPRTSFQREKEERDGRG